jgi:nicotinic acid mononucleotide adenylyltransferase
MGPMKNYKQLIKELPSKKVVFAFGRFNPPTTGHELLIKVVKKLAVTHNADHAIYASKTQDSKKNPLSVDKKVHYLNLMFPNTRFVAANNEIRTFIEAIKQLNKKYKNLIMVAGSDRVPEYQELLTKYNGKEFHFDTIQVVSAGERDPDADDAAGMSATKMRALAVKGDYKHFKTGLPSSIRDIDGRRLMNDIRQGMGLEVVKEQIKFTVDEVRDKYHKGEIYHVGEFVEVNEQRYEILDRGSNYLVLVDSTGNTSRKWIQDVTLSDNQVKEDISIGYAPTEITFKGYTTKNFNKTADAAKAFQDTISRASEKDPVAVLNALKATDTYMGINDRHIAGEELTDAEISEWKSAREKAKESLQRVGEFEHHRDYWHNHENELEGLLTNYKTSGQGDMNEELTDKTLRPTDKIKVARIIATMLGVDKVEGTSNPEMLVNNALRKIKTKALNPEGYKILDKMLILATEVGINYDVTLKPSKLKEASVTKVDTTKDNNISGSIMSDDDMEKLELMTKKHGHTMAPNQSDTVRKMKIKQHLGEGKTALEKWRAAAAERQKKHDAIEAEHEKKKANFEVEFKKWQKEVHGDNLKESHVEFRIDHRDKPTGDTKSTFADHEAKVSDMTDKATYVKVPSHKADSFKSAMKSKHGTRVELAESRNQADKYYDEAEKHKEEANKHKVGTEQHHYHMSNHYDAMHRYHSDLGQHGAADKAADKAEEHHEKSLQASGKGLAEAHKLGDKVKITKGSESGKTGTIGEIRHGAFKGAEKTYTIDHEGGSIQLKKTHFSSVKEEVEQPVEMDQTEKNLEDQLAAELDLTDEQIDHIVDSAQEDDFIEEYEDDELAVIDDETGEEIPEEECGCMHEEKLMEVLSRSERIRAKVRFAKTKSKRERRASIAARSHASNATINKRARRLAVKLMKKRLLRGRNINQLSVGEKERIERVLQKRKKVIGRVAMKLAPRVRAIEKARLSHTKFTKGTPNVNF